MFERSWEQDAFGDLTAIKIGQQYCIFADVHYAGTQSGSELEVARFTSDSWTSEFELLGSMGSGHPDPAVAFAEGQFYLVTQAQDWVTPGPWVAGVTARAGIDIDGDGFTDEWTGWQVVAESHDHKPGYARVVERTAASIDMSDLPAGHGIQFEFTIDDTIVAGVSPLLDRISAHLSRNLALGKPTEQATNDFQGHSGRAVDGNTSGVWTEGSVTHTQRQGSPQPWWRVDLGAISQIDSITVHNRTDHTYGERLVGARVFVGSEASFDPADYVEVGSLGSEAVQTLTVSRTGQFVLIRHEGSFEILSLAEVEVYGTPTTATAPRAPAPVTPRPGPRPR